MIAMPVGCSNCCYDLSGARIIASPDSEMQSNEARREMLKEPWAQGVATMQERRTHAQHGWAAAIAKAWLT